jgi:hypothetical protein
MPSVPLLFGRGRAIFLIEIDLESDGSRLLCQRVHEFADGFGIAGFNTRNCFFIDG